MYAMRLMTDWRVKTSIMVGRGKGGLLGLDGKESEKAFDVSEPAEEVGRRREADCSSYAECRRANDLLLVGLWRRNIVLMKETRRLPRARPQSFLCFFVSSVSCCCQYDCRMIAE